MACKHFDRSHKLSMMRTNLKLEVLYGSMPVKDLNASCRGPSHRSRIPNRINAFAHVISLILSISDSGGCRGVSIKTKPSLTGTFLRLSSWYTTQSNFELS